MVLARGIRNIIGLILLLPVLSFGQVEIIGTQGNQYQVWIGDSLDADYQFNDLHKAIQHSVNRGAWHPDSTLYIRRTEEYRVSGFGDYRMLGQLLWETSQTPDSAYSYTWNADSTAYETFTYELKKKIMAVNGSNYFEWTPNASQVTADEANPVLLITGEEIGAGHGFWSNVAADGSDIRVTLSDGSTEQPFHVIFIDTATETLFLRFRSTITLTASSPETFRVYYNSADSAYAVTDTFGRNAVYQDYEAWWGLDQDPTGTAPQITDYTGNGYDGTANGTPSQTSAVVDDGVTFNGGDYFSFSPTITFDDSMSFRSWAFISNDGVRFMIGDSTGIDDGFSTGPGSQQTWEVNRSLSFAGPYTENTWYLSVYTKDSSDNWRHYQDADPSSDNPIIDAQTVTLNAIGRGWNDGTRDFLGNQDELAIANFVYSADRVSLEYNNENDPATFATAGAEQTAGGGTTEVSFSLNSAANVSSSSTSIAEAGISLNADADVSDGSTATGESDLTISHIQQASTQSTAQAESSFSLASLLQIAFDKQSITDASFSLPTVHQVTTVSDTQEVNEASFSLALQKAISTEQISTIEVSYSLNTSQQAAMASDATGEAAMSMSLQAGLSLVSTALAEAEISFDAVQSMTITGQAVGVEVTLSDGRTLTIKLQNRTLPIASQDRTLTISPDNRTLSIDP